MKRWTAMLTAFILTLSVLFASTSAQAVEVIDEKLGVPIVVYGANLSPSEKQSVQTSLRAEGDVEEHVVTGQDLVKYIPDGNANARMFSSVKITRQDKGKGLVIQVVTPDNITQVTPGMYETAMFTAGVEDAIVEVAAPKPVTGHSALVGIYKAYEATGAVLDTDRTDVANDELSLATKLADEAGIDEDRITQLLTEIKQQIADQNPATKEDVERIVQEQLQKLDIQLSDADRQLLIDLMDRIRGLDIDFGKLSEQLGDLTSKLKEKFDSIDPSFWDDVKQFFRNLWESVRSFFSSKEEAPTPAPAVDESVNE